MDLAGVAHRWQGRLVAGGQPCSQRRQAGPRRMEVRRGAVQGQPAAGNSLTAATALKTSAETRRTRKNEGSTRISTSPRFNLSRWMKKTVVGGVKSTMDGS